MRQTAAHLQIDAFGTFMANVVDKHCAPKHLPKVWKLFAELATSAATTFMRAEDADQFAGPLPPSGGRPTISSSEPSQGPCRVLPG